MCPQGFSKSSGGQGGPRWVSEQGEGSRFKVCSWGVHPLPWHPGSPFPNPSSPRGLGGSLGRGLWLLSISYDKSKASNLMLLICRLIRLRVCQRPQRWAGAGHGTWLWALSTPSPCWQLPVKQNGWEQKCWVKSQPKCHGNTNASGGETAK